MSQQNVEIFKIILATIPFALMCFMARTTNLKKPYRGHQFLAPIFGVVYSIIAVVSFERFRVSLLKLVKASTTKMDAFAKQKPDFASFITPISQKIKGFDWNFYMLFIANVLILILFYIIKKCLLPLFKKLWSNENVYAATSGAFYDFVPSVSNYCLKDNMYAVKKLMKVYYIVATIMAIGLLIASQTYKNWDGFKPMMYPFVVVIVLGEIFFYLDGLTAAEYRNTYSGEDGSSSRRALYYPFKQYLQLVFGDRLIDSETFFPGFKHNNNDILKKYEDIESQEAQLASLYFYKKLTTRDKRDADALEERTVAVTANNKDIQGIQLDESLVDSTYKLMNGESVMFATPFYQDYTDYIFLPINRALSKGSKVLFILGRTGIEDDIKQWISSSLESVVNVPELWDIDELNDSKCYNGDVGIVTAATVFDENIVNTNKNFINQVTEIVMIEPSQFISTAQLSISVYVERVHKDATYYIFDRNNDGLVDTMSHIIKRSITSITPTNRERNISTYMLWKADGDNLSHKLFPSVARYLGMGTELIVAALKEQVSVGEWYAYNKFPLDEMKWISQQYYPVLCKYASLPNEQDELENRMKFSHNMWGAKKSEYKYMVVEDEFCNLYEVARQFQNRASKESFVNVISQNYLLRDYMQYNPKLFVNDPKAIPSFSPDFVRSDRNVVLELLLKLNSGPMFEDEIVRVLRYLGDQTFFDDYSAYDVKKAIHSLIMEYIPNVKRSVESIIDERDKVYYLKDIYADSHDTSIRSVLDALKSVYYVTEDEHSHKHFLDAKLYGQIYQSHIPGQHITISGKYYEILVIGGDKGVVLKRAGDHVNTREYYRQMRHYDMQSFVPDTKVGSHTTLGDIVIDRGRTTFGVDTTGYILMKNYGDFEHNCFKNEVSSIPHREYKNKSVIRLTLPNITDEQRFTITLLLNEIFKTTFPDNSDFLAAVTELPEGVMEGLMYSFTDNSVEEDDVNKYIYIIEDSVLDMGLIHTVERNIRRFFEIITDYICWHEEAVAPIVTTTIIEKEKVVVADEVLEKALNPEVPPEKKKKGFFAKLKEKFSKKKKEKKPKKEKKKKGKKGKPEEETPNDGTQTAPVDETPTESAPEETAPAVEAPAVEAPAVEAPIEEAPVEETVTTQEVNPEMAQADENIESAVAPVEENDQQAEQNDNMDGGDINE